MEKGDLILHGDSSGMCDRCGEIIKCGDGYLYFSSMTTDLFGEVGLLHCCQKCADIISTNEFFEKFKAGMGKVLLAKTPEDAMKGYRYGVDIGIVERCLSLGLNPQTAKLKARELAQEFWKDRNTGIKKGKFFWTQDRKEYKTITPRIQLVNSSKKWWEFWKR